VATSTDCSTRAAHDEQHRTDQQENDPDGPENGDPEEEAQQHQDETNGNHEFHPFLPADAESRVELTDP
jgi:hypothetical protein